MSISQQYAHFAHELSYDAVPSEIMARGKLLMLDAIGIAFASSGYEFARMAFDGIAQFGVGDSVVIGFGRTLPLRDAVLLNGMLVHGLDYDDTYLPGSVHMTASSVPCALGMSAHRYMSGRSFLTSCLLGLESVVRLGQARKGLFAEADGGTLFLDEIGDMSRPLQAKLLRFLEDGTFTRVGGNQELQVAVRLIAATNRDIIQAIRQEQFREDLFHRLNVVQFHPPPLRERSEDVLLLAEHFLRHFSFSMNKQVGGLSLAARQKLMAHHWPGNVRELRNAMERAVILETGPEIQPASLPDFRVETRLRKADADPTPSTANLDDQLTTFERDMILRALDQNGFNLTRAAEQLKISRHQLRYRVQRLNIDVTGAVDEDPATQRETA